jgi:hypothetical protein
LQTSFFPAGAVNFYFVFQSQIFMNKWRVVEVPVTTTFARSCSPFSN